MKFSWLTSLHSRSKGFDEFHLNKTLVRGLKGNKKHLKKQPQKIDSGEK